MLYHQCILCLKSVGARLMAYLGDLIPGDQVSVKGESSLLDGRRDLIPAEITKNRFALKYICVIFL